jgi:glutathione S-transferase
MRAFDELVRRRKGEYLIGDGRTYTIADIAAVCAVGHIDFAGVKPGWRDQYPELCEWWKGMDEKKHFADTRPVMFNIKTDSVV